jgi:hypothetical protein
MGKRVVIVDTSNEIGGDGDVPHPGIGRARRMQVASVAKQHQTMIEAVENHMPQVCFKLYTRNMLARRLTSAVQSAIGLSEKSSMHNLPDLSKVLAIFKCVFMHRDNLL